MPVKNKLRMVVTCMDKTMHRLLFMTSALYLSDIMNDNNNNNEILIKREPLVYTRAWRAVHKKENKVRTVQQQ